MKKLTLALLLCSGIAFAAQPAAQAAGNEDAEGTPPKVIMVKGSDSQKGKVAHSTSSNHHAKTKKPAKRTSYHKTQKHHTKTKSKAKHSAKKHHKSQKKAQS